MCTLQSLALLLGVMVGVCVSGGRLLRGTGNALCKTCGFTPGTVNCVCCSDDTSPPPDTVYAKVWDFSRDVSACDTLCDALDNDLILALDRDAETTDPCNWSIDLAGVAPFDDASCSPEPSAIYQLSCDTSDPDNPTVTETYRIILNGTSGDEIRWDETVNRPPVENPGDPVIDCTGQIAVAVLFPPNTNTIICDSTIARADTRMTAFP